MIWTERFCATLAEAAAITSEKTAFSDDNTQIEVS